MESACPFADWAQLSNMAEEIISSFQWKQRELKDQKVCNANQGKRNQTMRQTENCLSSEDAGCVSDFIYLTPTQPRRRSRKTHPSPKAYENITSQATKSLEFDNFEQLLRQIRRNRDGLPQCAGTCMYPTRFSPTPKKKI